MSEHFSIIIMEKIAENEFMQMIKLQKLHTIV